MEVNMETNPYAKNEWIVLTKSGEILVGFEDEDGIMYDSGRGCSCYAECQIPDWIWKKRAEVFWNQIHMEQSNSKTNPK